MFAMVGTGLSPSSKVETAGFTDENAAVVHKHGLPFEETLKGAVEATYIEGKLVWKRELYI